MNENTKQGYLKLATHFLKVRLIDKDIPVTAKNIKQALIASAPEYRAAYWRRLRCALVTQQREAGYSETAGVLETTVNPLTDKKAPDELKAQIKTKQKRRKQVTRNEHFQLKAFFKDKMDYSALAAIEIARILGCRPAEMLDLKMLDNNQVFITGAKKTVQGNRGLDRTVILSEQDYNTVSTHKLNLFDEIHFNRHKGKPEHAMHRIQHRLATATKKLWPKKKHQITLYSYRHQMGSDLKASGISRKEVAAVMGHQSVDSVNVYGHKRKSSRNLSIRATSESIAGVRKNTQRISDLIADKTVANAAQNATIPDTKYGTTKLS
ncbi:MAG: hypothetical protein DRQ40_03180 [Gammaproteobacteria bacterium]|nr:MAG: hypothetical protein DRQ40_03180 [Gammaproteobacteria bacterium]